MLDLFNRYVLAQPLGNLHPPLVQELSRRQLVHLLLQFLHLLNVSQLT